MEYFLILFNIFIVNLLLSGDNALVIALVSRQLSPRQQKAAAFWGGVGAIFLRVFLTLIAVTLLKIHFLQLLGGMILLWVAKKLIVNDHNLIQPIREAYSLREAVKTILIADLVMSFDNVIALAGVSKGNIPLLMIGLTFSIPIIIWSSKTLGVLMIRWPIIIAAGAAFLGWTAGDMVIADYALIHYVQAYPILRWMIPAIFATIVLLINFTQHNNRVQ